MHFSLKEESYVVIENGSWRIKAVIGVTDTNQFPSVLLQTEVGKIPEMEVEKHDSEMSQEDTGNLEQTALNSPERAASTKTVKEPKYVCGTQLKEFKEQYKSNFMTSFPIKRGNIENLDELEALWRHILLKEFNIKRTRNECPVIVTVPSSWTKVQYEQIARIFFEKFNSPGLYIANQALMALYGCNSLSGLVVDIGYGKTEITPILDCSIQHFAVQTIPIGGQDFDEYFRSLLLSDSQFIEDYGGTPDIDIARALKESTDICEVLLDASNLEDKPARMEVEYHGKKFTIGTERFHVAEPIFDPTLVNKEGVLSLTEAIYLTISSCEPDKRNFLWENIVLTGGSSMMKGLKERIRNDLAPYLTYSDNTGEYQVREAKFLKIPEYFTNLKDRQDLAGFLGASITAKLSFPDPKGFVNKVDYNDHGPSVVHTKSY